MKSLQPEPSWDSSSVSESSSPEVIPCTSPQEYLIWGILGIVYTSMYTMWCL